MRTLFFLGICFFVIACQPKKTEENQRTQAKETSIKALSYDLQHPVKVSELPKALKEISGITYVKDGQLAAINDEQGDLFLFDYRTGKVTDQRIWGQPGDYEDIAYLDGLFYVLRSDATLFKFSLDQTYQPGGTIVGGKRELKSQQLSLPGDKNEVEGLCYDPRTKWFFIAAKETKGKPHHYVYFYDPQRQASWTGIILRKANFEEEAGLSGKEVEFKPSAIAVHPKTQHVYILAANGHKLLVMNRQGGRFVSVEKLDPTVFEQPEGLCFAPDGTLFISGEGKKSSGKIWQFAERQ
ncbi:MAG: SdiA-regulated domain-containing protein [Siphonobacter sp.]